MVDLTHHGDAEAAPGLVDLAVNVRAAPPPRWLSAAVAASIEDLTRYPDPRRAAAAVAARHGRPVEEVLLTAGAAEAFVLLARALPPGIRPVVVHPQFTEPESALRRAGHPVRRLVLSEADGFLLHPRDVPEDADLVVVGNPTNPTSVLHPAGDIAALVRPGRLVVVDEAFADTVAGEPQSVSRRSDLVVIRSFTKTWGLAGLRIGYVLGPAEVIGRLREAQPLWAVSTPALAAAEACASPMAVEAEREIAESLRADRDHLVKRLEDEGVTVAGEPTSSFVLVRMEGADHVRERLRRRGYAVRRGDTFPGLGPQWLRIAVRDTATMDEFVHTLADVRREMG